MTIEEFTKLIGGKHATVMVCQVDGSMFSGRTYMKGSQENVLRTTAHALYEQLANTADGGEERRWIPKDGGVTDNERVLMNQHFEKVHKIETGESPIEIKKHKK